MQRNGRTAAAVGGMLMALATAASAQTFTVTGTQIPANLLKVNYGKLPNSIAAFDLNICNATTAQHAVTASQIYQALAESNANLQPLGRQIMLAVILQNQRRSTATVLTVVMNSAVGVLSILGAARTGVSPNLIAGAALGSAIGQQLLSNLKPVLSPDQVERYETQVLEPALVLDAGSCVERTVFTVVAPGAQKNIANLIFHIR